MALIIVLENEAWKSVRGLKALALKATDATLNASQRKKETTILFANDATLKILNRDWRGKNKSTNVLSFPTATDLKLPRGEAKPLGDIALAYETVAREAETAKISIKAHISHLIVHGMLHLLGHDHMNEGEAEIMEAREIRILKKLGIANPYHGNA